MPGNPPPERDERDALLSYIVQQRDGLKYAAYGLSEEQIRMRPTKSALTVGGLLKHAADTEQGWIDVIAGRERQVDEAAEEAYGENFVVTDRDSLESLIATFDEVAAETNRTVNGLVSLETRIQLPPAPWYPDNPDGYSARWILLHVIEELARHAGHADILREHIDGATMYELMAGAEGWPESEWIKPWRPAAP
jgi:uncharacterized damage-inducible protein DinB